MYVGPHHSLQAHKGLKGTPSILALVSLPPGSLVSWESQINNPINPYGPSSYPSAL